MGSALADELAQARYVDVEKAHRPEVDDLLHRSYDHGPVGMDRAPAGPRAMRSGRIAARSVAPTATSASTRAITQPSLTAIPPVPPGSTKTARCVLRIPPRYAGGMARGLERTVASSYTIEELPALAGAHYVWIPHFQRGQRWGPGDVAKRFDSIRLRENQRSVPLVSPFAI